MGCCYCASAQAAELSLEEKVGQLLMVHFHGVSANDDAQTLVRDIKVGGIIYYNWCNGLTSPEQIRALSGGLQQLAKGNAHPIPLLIAVDQEGGVVDRFEHGFTKFPGNRALGQTRSPQLAEAMGFAVGQELWAVGVNMDLAPVVDVNSNPHNPVIGVRSFGADPEIVVTLGKSVIKGLKRAKTIPTLKHFPGHGDTAVDSHENLPVIQKTKEQLEQMELFPFAHLAPFADAIMTAHILVPALDEEHCATLSEKTLTYLRKTLGFRGVIVSDSLVMEGILKACSTVEEAAIRAINAGCDLLILGGKLLSGERSGLELTVTDMQRIHQALVEAVKSGRIPQARIDEAVVRILALKKRYIMTREKELPLGQCVNTVSHRALAQKIASLAVFDSIINRDR